MSVLRTLILAAVISTSFAGAAYARDPVFTAKLATPVAERTQLVAGNAVWICEADTCRARPTHAVSVRACRQLAHESGLRVIEYGAEGDALTADEIARCNGETATQQAQN